jgi:hypothetical protein
MQIWRMEDFNKIDIPEDQYGSFYCSDSYVILYRYRAADSGKDSNIIYFWQGSESSRVCACCLSNTASCLCMADDCDALGSWRREHRRL